MSSITHAKFGEIELHAPAVGAKMWCLYVYRQDCAKRKVPVLNFFTGQKSGFSPRALHRFTCNLARPTGTWVRLVVQNLGTLKTREWKTEDHEKYGGRKRGTGKRGTKSHGWKREDWKTRDQIAWVEIAGLENAGPNFHG